MIGLLWFKNRFTFHISTRHNCGNVATEHSYEVFANSFSELWSWEIKNTFLPLIYKYTIWAYQYNIVSRIDNCSVNKTSCDTVPTEWSYSLFRTTWNIGNIYTEHFLHMYDTVPTKYAYILCLGHPVILEIYKYTEHFLWHCPNQMLLSPVFRTPCNIVNI